VSQARIEEQCHDKNSIYDDKILNDREDDLLQLTLCFRCFDELGRLAEIRMLSRCCHLPGCFAAPDSGTGVHRRAWFFLNRL
jgi:hypothetical protein